MRETLLQRPPEDAPAMYEVDSLRGLLGRAPTLV
jgi:hypothetical protein